MSKRDSKSAGKGTGQGKQKNARGDSAHPAHRGPQTRKRSYRHAEDAPHATRQPTRFHDTPGQRDVRDVRRKAIDAGHGLVRNRNVGQSVDAILDYYGLRRGFDPQVEREAEIVAAWDVAKDAEDRADFRALRTFTIDGADAKDFDDAVSIETLADGGVRLGVHIADVSWYVRPGTLVEAQAQLRATSVYLPDRVLPMLPEALSNGCCSLLPDQDRLTMSAMMDCDADGTVRSYELIRSVIHSRARLVYDDVNLLLQGDADQVARYADLLPDLQRMVALAAKLRATRMVKGALDLDVDESAITVDDRGEPVAVSVRPRGVSERMIEDFMLLANRVVATHTRERNLPCLYRVHEAIDPDKAAAFASFIHGLGLRLRGVHTGVTPQALQQVLKDAEALPEYPVVAQLLLRAMQKARYDPQPLGHFGLATENYCHFTSPIRRYPDLFVHRVLGAEMSGELRFCERIMRATAPALADHASERERNAMEAERSVEKLMKARFMAQQIGMEYEGVIVGMVEWGFYVALPNTVEGLVHVRTLPGFWTFHRERLCWVQQGSGPRFSHELFRLGQSVRIFVESVDLGALQINFMIADN